MNVAERFPSLSAVLVKVGLPVDVRRAALEAAAADLAGPPVQGQGHDLGDDDASLAHQGDWATAFATADPAA